ncbi:MAG: hypothetical protein QM756_13415 [Polyangiaceae bacterium]
MGLRGLRSASTLATTIAASIGVACGGQTASTEHRSDAAGGAPNATSGGAPVMASGGAPVMASGGVAGAVDGLCPSYHIGFTPRSLDTVETSSGITVEPLQVPMPISVEWTPYLGPRDPDPSTWDRSPLPKNACVYRLRGVNADCYPLGGSFWATSCDALSAVEKVLPFSFYEAYGCHGVAPGCPSSELNPDAPGQWWYLVPVGPSEADLVICAPECAMAYLQLDAACLSLIDSRDRCQ